MTIEPQRPERRADALSKARIVAVAIELLDAGGESALTFRALTGRLATGSGAIYHHVADKDDLLAAASDSVITQVIGGLAGGSTPRETIRTIAGGVFDAIDVHPWVGAQLHREPWRPAMLQIFEGIGGQLQALGVPELAQFDAAAVLLNYILGVAGQNAANARMHPPGADRTALLSAIAARWMQHDPAQYPFVHRIAVQFPEHDDREQFLAGIDLILAGIAAAR